MVRLAVLAVAVACGRPEPSGPVAATVLEVHEPPEYRPRLVARDPDAALIAEPVHALPWQEVTFVVLVREDGSFLEGSGSLRPEDGFSAKFGDGDREHVSSRPPESLEDVVRLLQSFRAGDGSWREAFDG